MLSYHQAIDFFMFDSEFTKLLLTPNGNLYSWMGCEYRKFTRNKFNLPAVSKIVKQQQKFFIITKNGNLYSWNGSLFYTSHILSKVELHNVKVVVYNSYYTMIMTQNGDMYYLNYNNHTVQMEISTLGVI
jgi:hypothetical protein